VQTQFSTRRVLLVVAFILLVIADLAFVRTLVDDVSFGQFANEANFKAEGKTIVPGSGSVGLSAAALQLPVVCALLWLTYKVGNALRG
jgi:hypothetical protein